MDQTCNAQSTKARISISLKVGATLAVLSLMALTAQPQRLSAAAPSYPAANAEMASLAVATNATDGSAAARDMSVPTPSPGAAS